MIDWTQMVTAEATKIANFAKAKTEAIAELLAVEKATEDKARLDRAAVLIGDPKTDLELEQRLRDLKPRGAELAEKGPQYEFRL